MRISWSDELDELMERSFKRHDHRECLEHHARIWELNGPDPATHAPDATYPPDGIYTLGHLQGILGAWRSVYTHNHGAIPSRYEMPVIDRSIEYWNARGYSLSRPDNGST